jgi:hypothetical protein
MPETIDPPIEEPPVPPTPTRPKPTAPPEPPEPEPDEKASAMTFGQRLNAAAQSLKGRGTTAEIEQLRGQMAVLTVERDQARIEATAAKAILTKVTAERDAARKTVAEQEAAVTDFEKKVIDASIDLVAQAHVPVAELPVSGVQGESAPQTKEQVEAALEGKSFQEKRAILQAWNNRSRK